MWMLTETSHARHPIFLYHVRVLSQYTSSWVWHPRYGRKSVPIRAVVLPSRPWSISWGVYKGHLIHLICLLIAVATSQTIGASSFCTCASPQNLLDVYPTMMWVLCVIPISMHQTVVVLVFHFQIFSRIHPPLSIHHMSTTLMPQLSHNTVI